MLKKLAFIIFVCALVPRFGYAACSRANLTRCLDSACAVNITANPAARCQYCGCGDAGAPDTGLRSVSVGASGKYNISAKELKSAPSTPGERYVWASQKCLDIVPGCTVDDIDETYDDLITKSCSAAQTNAKMSDSLSRAQNNVKTKNVCESEITDCMGADKRCAVGFGNCAADTDFDSFFSECSIAATGCDAFLADIRTSIRTMRDDVLKRSEDIIAAIIKKYQDDRTTALNAPKTECKDNAGRDTCIADVCATRMPNKCEAGSTAETEKSVAAQLCGYYVTACSNYK